MAHQCTACGRTFEDGSTAMLSGCPDCGGNTFQYFKGEPPETTGTPPERAVDTGVSGTVGETVGKARAAVSGFVGGDSTPTSGSDPASGEDDILVADERSVAPESTQGTEASTETVAGRAGDAATPAAGPEPDTESSAPESTGSGASGADGPTPSTAAHGDRSPAEPSLEELRAELNDQFESIKILEPGQYELNLMELYEREEHIIALQEDGRYVIDVPGTGQFAND